MYIDRYYITFVAHLAVLWGRSFTSEHKRGTYSTPATSSCRCGMKYLFCDHNHSTERIYLILHIKQHEGYRCNRLLCCSMRRYMPASRSHKGSGGRWCCPCPTGRSLPYCANSRTIYIDDLNCTQLHIIAYRRRLRTCPPAHAELKRQSKWVTMQDQNGIMESFTALFGHESKPVSEQKAYALIKCALLIIAMIAIDLICMKSISVLLVTSSVLRKGLQAHTASFHMRSCQK